MRHSELMTGICEGRVVVVSGAGRGIGREHALEFARQGAKVVVNDLGVAVDGTHPSSGPAADVVEEIRALGGDAVANSDDASDVEGAARMVRTAIDTFGHFDTLVNNAGIFRDRMLVNMTADEWDAVIRVHLRGTFAPTHAAVTYWRERSKAGVDNDARIVNTTSPSGIYGNVGQINYGTAKAGIAAFTVIAAMELDRYGVTVNAIAPGALTRMTQGVGMGPQRDEPQRGDWDPSTPDNIAPLAVWLGSNESSHVTGRVFNVMGGHLGVAEGWVEGPAVDKDGRWDPIELSEVVTELVANAASNAKLNGRRD